LPERLQVIGLGAGGHGRVVLEALVLRGEVMVVGLLDPRRELWGTEVMGVPVLGGDDELGRQYDGGVRHVFIGLGGAADTAPRRRLYEFARGQGCHVASVVHPAAIVSPSASVEPGAQVRAGAVVGTSTAIGENAIVNTGAVVDHDCRVEPHAHVATGARIASSAVIGEGAHVGAGATVIQEITIGAGAIVGAGAVVIRDVSPRDRVVGVPARSIAGGDR